ncbi:hypothetical protein AB3R30_06270 [Leptolyngbyaceae cyanobacterium UHCC 1019]
MRIDLLNNRDRRSDYTIHPRSPFPLNLWYSSKLSWTHSSVG